MIGQPKTGVVFSSDAEDGQRAASGYPSTAISPDMVLTAPNRDDGQYGYHLWLRAAGRECLFNVELRDGQYSWDESVSEFR